MFLQLPYGNSFELQEHFENLMECDDYFMELYELPYGEEIQEAFIERLCYYDYKNDCFIILTGTGHGEIYYSHAYKRWNFVY